MACSIDEIKFNSLNKVEDIFTENEKGFKKDDNGSFFMSADVTNPVSKIQNSLQKTTNKIREWAEDLFGKSFTEGWLDISNLEDSGVSVSFRFPKKLEAAYIQKINEEGARSVQRDDADRVQTEYTDNYLFYQLNEDGVNPLLKSSIEKSLNPDLTSVFLTPNSYKEKLKKYDFTNEEIDYLIEPLTKNPSLWIDAPSVHNLISFKVQEQIKFDNTNTSKKANKELDNILLDFLKPLNISVKEYEDLKSKIGVDALGFANIIEKSILLSNNRNIDTLPEEAAHFYVELLVKKSTQDNLQEYNLYKDLISKIESWEKYEDIKKKYLLLYKDENKVKKEAIAQAIAEAIVNRFESKDDSLKQSILDFLEWLKSVFKTNKNFNIEMLADDVAKKILSKDYSDIPKDLNKAAVLTNYEDIDEDTLKLISIFSKFGANLTGSMSLRKQGTIYRTPDETFHDLDFKVPIALKEDFLNKVNKEFPNITMVSDFENQMSYNTIWKLEYNGKEYSVDFFFDKIGYNSSQDGLVNWRDTFAAKIAMGREKDVIDFINYVPTDKTNLNSDGFYQKTPIEKELNQPFDLKSEVEKLPQPFKKVEPKFIEQSKQKEIFKNLSENRQKVVDKMFDILKQLGVSIEETTQIFNKQKEINSLKDKLSTNLNDKQKTEIQKQIELLEKEGYNEDVLVMADTLNGVLQFVKGQLTDDNFTEDVVHFVVDVLEQKNPELYQKFKNDITKFKIYQETLESYKKLPQYRKENGAVNFDKIKKEAIAKVLSSYLLGEPVENDVTNFINLWQTSKDFIKSLFNKLSKSNVNQFQEFSKKLLNDYIEENDKNFKLSGEEFYSVKSSKNIQKRLSFTQYFFGKPSSTSLAPNKSPSEVRNYFESFRDKISKVEETNEEGEKEEFYELNGSKVVRATSIASYKKAYENVNPSEVAKLKREASLGSGNLIHDLFYKIGKRYINENTGELRDVPTEKPENSEYYLVENTDKLPSKTLDITDKDVSDVIYKGKQKVYSKSNIGLNSIIEKKGIKFKVSLTEFNGEFYEYYITPIDLYDVLEYHFSNIVNSYPKGALFSQELPVINEEAGYGGTLDFIAFLPNGKMDILDWKSTDMYYTNTSGERVKRENVSPFNEIYWKNQLGLYKNAIYSHMPYFVKDKVGLFEKSMAIPIGLDIKMRLIDPKKGYIEGNKEYKIEKIKIVDITDVFTVPDDDFAFIPVATDEQTTGIEELDKAIEKLWALHERIKNFPLKEGESYAKKNIELQNIRDAIKELQIKHSATKFLNTFNKSYLRFDNLKNKDISYLENAVKNNTELSEQENEDLGEYMSDLFQGIEFLKSMQEFPTILSQLKIDKTSSEYEKRLVEYTASLSTSSKILIEDLSNIQLKLVDLIAKQEGMQNYLELDIQQSKLEKWINNTRSWMSREEKSVALAGKIYNTAAYLSKKDVSDYFSNEGKFRTVKENLDKWVKENKTSLKKAYELLTEKNKNGDFTSLANDISKEWYEFFSKKRDEFQDYYNALAVEAEKKQLKGSKARDYIESKYKVYVESFFNENYDIPEYLKELQEKFTKESERIKKLEFSTDPSKNAEEVTKHLLRWRENNNVFRNPKALFNDYNSIKKHFKKEKWYSEKYKTIVKNKALLDTYELFREINIEAVKLGMLDDVSTKGKFLAKVLLPDSFISLLKYIVLRQFDKAANYINYKFDPYGQKVQSIYIDPLSGKPIRKIAVKYKYTPENDESQLSEDLFSMFTLWKSHIIKYKHLKNIENKLLTVQMVESLKRVEETIPGDKKIKTQSNTIIDNSKSKLQAKKSEADEVLDNYLEKYLYSTGTERDSLQRIFEFLRDWAQSVHIGLKPSSWISNYIGANFNAKLLNNKWMTAEDYDYANMVQTGVLIPDKVSPELSKKALFLIKHLNTRIHSELDNPALEGLIENTQSRITNVAYFGYKYGEHIIQDNIAIAHFLNATIKNGQIVNISDYVKSKYPNITNLSEKERIETSKKINVEIKNLKENDNLFSYIKKNGDKYILEGLSKKEEIKFYNTVKNKIESAIGGIDPDNASSLKNSFIASLIMMYKQWIPRLLLARLENFRKDSQTGEYTYGRSNAFSNVLFSQYFLNVLPSFLKTLGKTSLRGIPFYYKSDTIKSLTETTPYQSQWLVEAGKKKYLEKYQEFSKNGRQLDITQDQFVELFSNSVNSQLREFSVLTVFTAIVMLISAGADGDDEDDVILDPIASALGIRSFAESNKNIMRLMSRVLFKTNRDLWFAFSPQQTLEIFQDVSPLLPFMAQLIALLGVYSNEVYSRIAKDEAEENKVKSLHKTIKVIPYASEIDFIFLNTSEDYREFLGEEEPNQMEF